LKEGKTLLFSSSVFLWLFFPAVVIFNFLLNIKFSNYLLLTASLLFYAWGEPVYVLLMLFSIIMNWTFGMLIAKADRGRKICLALCITANLLLLGYYKYFNFFANTMNDLTGSQWISARNIALPIGISFFTFQALSYVIDLYRGNCNVQKNMLNLALYISFFPQLIAGPIVRYADIDEQIGNRSVSKEKFALGLRRFLYGLGKKVVLSNCMAEIADAIFGLQLAELTTSSAWLGAVAYTMQIYYDFSGYSDMAIGLGLIFGFHFLENFNYPYLSRSIREFWQRWHISLGTWFREYVYIPLGGNRNGSIRTYVNLFIVFFLTGMWHGASWNFVAWGLFHGVFQIIERLGLNKFLKKHNILGHIYCLLVVVFGWVFFRLESLTDGIRYILRMILPWRYCYMDMFALPRELTIRNSLFLLLAIIGSGMIQHLGSRIPGLARRWKYSILELVFLMLLFAYCMILLASGTYNPFIYFRF